METQVYINYSVKTEKYYVGHSQDPVGRLRQHNEGLSRWSRTGIPWCLIFSEACSSRGAAMKMERKIKKIGAKRFLERKFNIVSLGM